MAAKMQQATGSGGNQEGQEFSVRLSRNVSEKTYHVMRFKPPHKCDLEKLINPTLERQTVTKVREEEIPESGEGSEYGRKRREEARKRRRGLNARATDPDDCPWVLQERKKGGKHFVGRKEGTVNASSSYFIFKVHDEGFEVEPVKNWYDFVPPVKYNYLDADEAEQEFERRNKTLNYFSIMVSKKMKSSEEGEEGGPSAVPEPGGIQVKLKKEKKKAVDSGLLLTDSDSAGSSSENDSEDSSGAVKGKGGRVNPRNILKRKKRVTSEVEEAGEETDEGDMESREVDYMSDSSSNSELEFLAKEANKELPKDDQEIERKEEEEIDQGFVESSSSEDELTEKGKELRELMKKQSGGDKESDVEEEEGEGEEDMETESPEEKRKGSPSSSSPGKKGSKGSSKHSRKREGAARESPVLATPEPAADAAPPPEKKQRMETSTNSITEEEVKRYLMRKPITSKDLVKKFTSKKTDMDRNKIVKVLHQIIEGLKNVEKQSVKGKLYMYLATQKS